MTLGRLDLRDTLVRRTGRALGKQDHTHRPQCTFWLHVFSFISEHILPLASQIFRIFKEHMSKYLSFLLLLLGI